MNFYFGDSRGQARFKQLKESVVLAKFLGELRRLGLLSANGLVWGDEQGTALVELAAHHSHVVVKKIWAVECGRGDGSALLAVLCEAADALGVSLRLEVRPFRLSLINMLLGRGRPDAAWNRSQLAEWYAQFPYLGIRRGKRPGALSKRELAAWYERAGFVHTGYGSLMIRKAVPLNGHNGHNGHNGYHGNNGHNGHNGRANGNGRNGHHGLLLDRPAVPLAAIEPNETSVRSLTLGSFVPISASQEPT